MRNKIYVELLSICLLLCLLAFPSCQNKTKVESNKIESPIQSHDTVLVKVANKQLDSYNSEIYSRTLGYIWVAGKDTLPFKIYVSEYRPDTSFSIHLSHRNAILFSEVSERLEECMELIGEDFKMIRCNYISMQSPILYPDMVKGLSESYMQQYGKKNVKYPEVNKFLVASSLHSDLNKLIAKYGLEVSNYGIEKFQFVPKGSVAFDYPNLNTTNYPEYIIHGMGMSVRLKAKMASR